MSSAVPRCFSADTRSAWSAWHASTSSRPSPAPSSAPSAAGSRRCLRSGCPGWLQTWACWPTCRPRCRESTASASCAAKGGFRSKGQAGHCKMQWSATGRETLISSFLWRSFAGMRRWRRRSDRSLDVGLPSPPARDRDAASAVSEALSRLMGRPACRAFLLTSVVLMIVLLMGVIIFLFTFRPNGKSE